MATVTSSATLKPNFGCDALITWGGTAAGSTTYGEIQTISYTVGGERKELKNHIGEVFALLKWDEHTEVSITAIRTSDTAAPALHDAVYIGTRKLRVTSFVDNKTNEGETTFTLTARDYNEDTGNSWTNSTIPATQGA